jgi:hypothetical protein
MGLVTGVWLAVLGVLGASSLIIARKPDAKEMIAKLAPYQGWIGAVSALWGAWWTINAILNLGLLAHFPIMWITWLATGLVMLLLGFLLGIGIMKTFVKDPTANAKADQMLAKLSPYQGTLGLIALGLGVWNVISSILH